MRLPLYLSVNLIPVRALFFLLLLCACGPALQVEVSKTKNLPVTISYENLSLSVDPETGGRVTRYEINGVNVLKPNRNKSEIQFGSSTWTNPQSAWIEAVEPPFDNCPFQITKQQKWSMTLLSEQDKNTGLQLKKSFRFSPVETGIYLLADYTLYNNGQDTLFRGLWENSSVAYDGVFTFYADSVKTDTDIELAKKRGGNPDYNIA
ncbi:MAG: hypothetical protein AB8H12_13210 [Lewinella sp.]